jgi:putative DNA primase/helicase
MHQRDPLSELARGRWPSILSALGVGSKYLTGKNVPCPMCGGKDRFRFTDWNQSGRYICNQCGNGDGADLVMKVNGWDFKRAAEEIEAVIGGCQPSSVTPVKDEQASREKKNKLWRSAKSVVRGDFVDMYLDRRGLRQDVYPRCLRAAESIYYHADIPSWHPAMLAMVEDANGKPVNIHRTYLTLGGDKARLDPARKMMPGELPDGSAVRLHEAGPVLGIAEGIETAFAASELFRIPVWAALSANQMARWFPPEGTDQVIVFGDNDKNFTGQRAAFELAGKLAGKLPNVRVEIPPTEGQDWNDILLEKRKKAA